MVINLSNIYPGSIFDSEVILKTNISNSEGEMYQTLFIRL